MTAERYIQIQSEVYAKIRKLENRAHAARERVVIPPREKLRPATSEDMVAGNVIYHEREEKYGGWFWHIINEVKHPVRIE